MITIAKHTTLSSLFTAIADAIRAKKGSTETIIADNFPDEIASIAATEGKEVYSGSFSVDSQHTSYSLDVGVTLSEEDVFILVANITVEGRDKIIMGALKTPSVNFISGMYKNDSLSTSNSISYSGTNVNIKNTPYIERDATYYWYLIKDGVSGSTSSTPAVIEPLDVTENGTYTAPEGIDGYSPVTVNVEPDVETETWEFTLEDDSVVTKEVQLVAGDGEGGSGITPNGYADVSGVTATAADVLASKKIVLSNGTLTDGTIQTRTSNDLYTNSTYPDRVYTKAGYYASDVYKSVGTASLPAPSITIDTVNERIVSTVKQTSSGYVVKDSYNDATLSLPMQDADEITPGTEAQTAISAGYYAKGDITVAGDTDLVPGNIKSGVTIFGVTGSYVGSSGGSGHNSKIRFVQCTALSASGEVFSFILDDYDFYNDYIKLIVGSITLRKSNYISYFLGEDRNGNGCGWELITYDGSKTDGNNMLSYAVSGNVVTIYSDGTNTNGISYSFAKGSTYSLYVVYGTP